MNKTPVAPENPVPVMVTDVPSTPNAGLNEVMAGVTTPLTVSCDAEVEDPNDVCT